MFSFAPNWPNEARFPSYPWFYSRDIPKITGTGAECRLECNGLRRQKLSKYLTQTFMSHCYEMLCQQVPLSGYAEWPKVADAVIEAEFRVEE
jgi:hypothetical protein